MSDKTAEHLDRIKTSLDNAQTGLWDKHYGKGLSADYARAVDGDIRAALESLTALRSSIEEMERQRKSWEAANQDVQCKLDCAWKTHNNYADKVERAIGSITDYEASIPIPEIIARRGERVASLEKALRQIAVGKPNWCEGVGSYAGGETWSGFAESLQRIARAALSTGECQTDGHYLCRGCGWISQEALIERGLVQIEEPQ